MTVGFGGIVRKATSFFTGGGGQLDEEAQNSKSSSTPNSTTKMYPNKYPSYFMTPKILNDYLKSTFGPHDFKIKIVMDYFVFETPNKPLSASQRAELERLTDSA